MAKEEGSETSLNIKTGQALRMVTKIKDMNEDEIRQFIKEAEFSLEKYRGDLVIATEEAKDETVELIKNVISSYEIDIANARFILKQRTTFPKKCLPCIIIDPLLNEKIACHACENYYESHKYSKDLEKAAELLTKEVGHPPHRVEHDGTTENGREYAIGYYLIGYSSKISLGIVTDGEKFLLFYPDCEDSSIVFQKEDRELPW